jgi:hypothetical protein
MKTLLNKWAAKVPRYSANNADLFEKFVLRGNVAEHDVRARGLVFSSYYELYIYAFFLGLYYGPSHHEESGDKMTDFGHPIEHWGKKGSKLLRTDYSEIKHYLFAGSVMHAKVDFIELDKGGLSIDDAATAILRATEAITNSGLLYLRSKLVDKESFGAKPLDFVRLIMEAPVSSNSSVDE